MTDATTAPQNQDEYDFSNTWFMQNIPNWDALLPRFEPKKILEIGSYEGRSACYLIEKFSQSHPLEIHCIDSWKGGVEHERVTMATVESRFTHNIDVALRKAQHPVRIERHKKYSADALIELIAAGNSETFDVIYIDGSHQPTDVLTDAILSFRLLRVGGLMIFDDYVWSMEEPGSQDSLNMPKPAIDAFVNIFQRKVIVIHGLPLYQLYVAKYST